MGTHHTSLSVVKRKYTDISDTNAQLTMDTYKYMLKQLKFTQDIKGNLPVGEAQVSILYIHIYQNH